MPYLHPFCSIAQSERKLTKLCLGTVFIGYFRHFRIGMLDKRFTSMHNARMSHAQKPRIPGDVCFISAYAKINLTLDVLGPRADGYHALTTIMQTVDLCDTLCLTAIEEKRVELICSIPELSNEQNLAARAARVLLDRFAPGYGVRIELHKRIPMAAGLGGGSSDAAATLVALANWWQLPITSQELHTIAAQLGSDVPFFLQGGLALCEGRGEQVTALPNFWPRSMRWLLLLKPSIGLSTAEVFRHLSVHDFTDGAHSKAVISALEAGRQPDERDIHNSLERGVLERYPEVAQAKAKLLQAGSSLVRLSGSGPTLFAPFAELALAREVQERVQARGYETYLTRAMYPGAGYLNVF